MTNFKRLASRAGLEAVLAIVALLAAAGAEAGSSRAAAKKQQSLPAVLPVDTRVHGRNQAGWSEAWWQWAQAIPAARNPVLDPTGAHCAEAQSGPV